VPAERIAVEVVCAQADRQTVVPLVVDAGCTAGQAVELSGVFSQHPDLDPAACDLGIFGREIARDHRLSEGDRVEILRPLPEDPRERRRRLARQGRTMGRDSA
jgi:uncharacterized protein